MQGEEILRIIRRIIRDFAPLLPGLRFEVVPPEGFRARARGKPIIADEAMLHAVLEEASDAPRRRVGTEGAPAGGPARTGAGVAGEGEGSRRARPCVGPAFREPGKGSPGEVTSVPGAGGARKFAENGERRGEAAREGAEVRYPLYALPASHTIMVEMESLTERVNREDRRLHRPLVEGLVLREVLYLITSGQPLPEPRARAERILRRHWPFQYAVLRSVGLTVTGYERPPQGSALGRDN